MLKIDHIKAPIQKEMDDFEKRFSASMKSSVPLLDRITHYIVRRKGKQMRPMFVFLAAGVCGKIDESTYRGAGLIELLHTATLVHDDVVDDSNLRRGFFSINALWKNKIAVLVGDYLLSRGLLLSVENNDFDLLKIVSEAVRQMSEGELLQIEKARRLDIEEPVYYDIIQKKTASLIASCCAVGAASAGMNTAVIEKMRLFGEKTGIAFQIKDDLFDFGDGVNTGKPAGTDIKESKFTLPLIYALQHTDSATKRRIIHTIKNNDNEPEKVNEVLNFVHGSGGIEYAREKMNTFRNEAYDILNSFPESPYRTALQQLVQFTTERSS